MSQTATKLSAMGATECHQIMCATLGTNFVSHDTGTENLKTRSMTFKKQSTLVAGLMLMRPVCKDFWKKISIQPLKS